MLFTRASSCAMFFLTFGLMSSATPIKRDTAAGVSSVLSTVTRQISSISSQFTSTVTTINVISLFSELNTALKDASDSLSAIPTGGGPLRPQDSAAIASTVSGLITGLVETLTSSSVITSDLSNGFVLGVDNRLDDVLKNLGIVSDGTLGLVADSMKVGPVISQLQDLGLYSVLETLGL